MLNAKEIQVTEIDVNASLKDAKRLVVSDSNGNAVATIGPFSDSGFMVTYKTPSGDTGNVHFRSVPGGTIVVFRSADL